MGEPIAPRTPWWVRGPVWSPLVYRLAIWVTMLALFAFSYGALIKPRGLRRSPESDPAPISAHTRGPTGSGGAIAGIGLALVGAFLAARARGRSDAGAWRRIQRYFGGVTALFLVLGALSLLIDISPADQGLWQLEIGGGGMGFPILISHAWAVACTSYCSVLQPRASVPEVFE